MLTRLRTVGPTPASPQPRAGSLGPERVPPRRSRRKREVLCSARPPRSHSRAAVSSAPQRRRRPRRSLNKRAVCSVRLPHPSPSRPEGYLGQRQHLSSNRSRRREGACLEAAQRHSRHRREDCLGLPPRSSSSSSPRRREDSLAPRPRTPAACLASRQPLLGVGSSARPPSPRQAVVCCMYPPYLFDPQLD